MLNSFGGNARNRPRVNLGGRRRELNKDELLKKASDDRKSREITRRQDLASRVIQKTWATWRAKVSAQDVLRQEYDYELARIVSSEAGVWSQANTPAMQSALRLYYFFFDNKRDAARTLEIAGYMTTELFGTNDAHRDVSVNMMERLVECALDFRPRSDQGICIRYAIDRSLKLCILQKPTFDSKSAMERYYHLLLNDLACLRAEEHSDSDRLAMVYDHVVCPLKADSSNFSAFCKYILRMPVLDLHPRLKAMLLEVDLKALISAYGNSINYDWEDESNRADDFGMLSSVDPSEIQLGNFIDLTAARVSLDHKELQDSWMFTIIASMNRLWFKKWRFMKGPISGNVPVSVSSARTWLTEKSVAENRSIDGIDPLIKHKLDSLSDTALLLALLQPRPVKGISLYFSSLLTAMPTCRDRVLLTLSIFASNSSSPYNLLDQSYTWWITRMDACEEICGDTIFFLELLSRILLTMVDEEFFDAKKRPFSMNLIKDTAARLKTFGCDLFLRYSSETIVEDGPLRIGVASCQELVARVLQQIQIRDSRRSFLTQDFWLNTTTTNMPILTPQIAFEAFIEQEVSDDDNDDEEEGAATSRVSNKWYVNPKVKLLNNFPFFFPFSTRIETLQALISADSEMHGFNDFFNRATRHHVVCRREHEFEDGFAALWQIGGGVKGPLSVDYRDVHGMQEAGIDGGGLTKEFLTAMCKQAFHPDFGLFVETPERSLYPNPVQSARSTLQLQHFEFLGRIIAKCIYEGILVDVTFAPFFLLNWIGKLAYIDDLQALDKDLYNGLIQLKNYAGDVENDLSLDFTVNENAGLDQQTTINLITNGRETPVTKSNRLQYIHLMSHFKLNVRIARQSQAFVRGMSEVLDLRWLGMFNQNEMQALVGGAPVPIDIDDLRQNTIYGGFDERDLTVSIFWDVLKEFNNEERRKLVKFVTSTPRPPLLGFKELNPKFSLRNAGSDVQRLPTASTCVNLLKLPAYSSHEQMRNKLRLSITAEAGFDLS